MTRYRVIVAERATLAVVEYAEYIATRSGSWRVAEDWVQHVYDEFELLEYLPDRYERAQESTRLDYVARRLLIGKYVAYYHVDEGDKVVRILGFRHGARMPRRGDLPDRPDA